MKKVVVCARTNTWRHNGLAIAKKESNPHPPIYYMHDDVYANVAASVLLSIRRLPLGI